MHFHILVAFLPFLVASTSAFSHRDRHDKTHRRVVPARAVAVSSSSSSSSSCACTSTVTVTSAPTVTVTVHPSSTTSTSSTKASTSSSVSKASSSSSKSPISTVNSSSSSPKSSTVATSSSTPAKSSFSISSSSSSNKPTSTTSGTAIKTSSSSTSTSKTSSSSTSIKPLSSSSSTKVTSTSSSATTKASTSSSSAGVTTSKLSSTTSSIKATSSSTSTSKASSSISTSKTSSSTSVSKTASSSSSASKTSSLSSTTSSTVVSAIATASSFARGLGLNSNGYSKLSEFTGLGWYYNWAISPFDSSAVSGFEFVPMVWGEGSIPSVSSATFPSGTKYILGFNEPDMSSSVGGSNLNASYAATLHQKWTSQLTQKDLKIGSPAVARGSTTWFSNWVTACAGKCQFDFVPIHFYGDNAADMISYIKTFPAQGKPIWVTEWSCMDYSSGYVCTSSEVKTFINTVITWARSAEGKSYVQRWAWFGAFPDQANSSWGMENSDASPNALAEYYLTL